MTQFCCCAFARKLVRMPLAAWCLLAASVGALVSALIGQYFFGMAPCILCLYQRVPYILVALIAVLLLTLCKTDKLKRGILMLCAVTFLIGSGIAAFHSGVERKLWVGTDECGVEPLSQPVGEIDIKKLREELMHTDVVRCDVIDFSLFGVTLANMNVFAFLGLALFAGIAAKQVGKPEPEETSCICCCRK